MNIANLKVSQRLALGFGMVSALMVIIVVLGVTRMQLLAGQIDEVVNDRYEKTAMLSDIENQINQQARSIRNIILLYNTEEIEQEQKRIRQTTEKITQGFVTLEKQMVTAEGQQLMKMIDAARAQFVKTRDHIAVLAIGGQKDEARDLLLTQLRPVQQAYFEAIDKMIALQAFRMRQSGKEAEEAAHLATALMLGLGTFAVLFGILAGWLITRSLTRQLGGEPDYAMQVMGLISHGDLSTTVTTNPRDDSSLLAELKSMQENLVKIVSEVRHGTDTIATASGQIAAGNQDLSSRTEEQASSLEETASSMEELTSTVKQNADNARQANQLAMSASEVASRGGAVVAQVVDTMDSINSSSKKIVDIISVIDGIAFQTNILALNAAVEAARAGEQGRGFAVVATEVRNLAQRSAAAAKEIKTLIDDSVNQVDTGAKLVNEAGATMTEIVDSIQRVTDIMGEMTAASQEQTSGIEQINQAITQMDQVTQQNAALVEEAAAASASMQEQAGNLAQVVAVFKLDRSQQPLRTQAPALRSAPLKVVPSSAGKAKAAGAKRLPAVQVASNDEWEQF